jgi:hypothetical protein
VILNPITEEQAAEIRRDVGELEDGCAYVKENGKWRKVLFDVALDEEEPNGEAR